MVYVAEGWTNKGGRSCHDGVGNAPLVAGVPPGLLYPRAQRPTPATHAAPLPAGPTTTRDASNCPGAPGRFAPDHLARRLEQAVDRLDLTALAEPAGGLNHRPQ